MTSKHIARTKLTSTFCFSLSPFASFFVVLLNTQSVVCCCSLLCTTTLKDPAEQAQNAGETKNRLANHLVNLRSQVVQFLSLGSWYVIEQPGLDLEKWICSYRDEAFMRTMLADKNLSPYYPSLYNLWRI